MITVALFTSCTKDQEDLFDDSSANRADAAIAAGINILTGATNGWLMQYFPDSQQQYGGYNMIARFGKDGKVEVSGEMYGEPFTSMYSVTQSAGIVLTFDTFNPEFHSFSDPSAPLGGNEGKGLDGDYDFSILKASADSVILKGKKTGNRVVMTPMKDADWEGYINNIYDIEDAMLSKKYSIKLGGEEIIALRSDRTLLVSYEEEGEEMDATISYIITPQGMKFYEPITIKGQTFSGFNYVAGADVFPASDNGAVTLNIIYPTLAEQVIESYWFLALSGFGDFGQQFWGVLPQIQEALGERLNYTLFGTYANNFGITFNSGGYGGSLLFNYAIVSGDELMLQFAGGNNNDNGAWYMNNASYAYMVYPFAYGDEIRTFKLTADDPNNPSWIMMTDEENPDNVIVLYGSTIYYPLEN